MDFRVTQGYSPTISLVTEEHVKLANKIEELLVVSERDGHTAPSTQQVLIEVLNLFEGIISQHIDVSEGSINSILHILTSNKDLLGQVLYPHLALCLLNKANLAETGQHERLQLVQNASWLCPNLSSTIPLQISKDLYTSLAGKILNSSNIDYNTAGTIALQLLEPIPPNLMQNSEILIKAKAYLFINSPKEAITLLQACISQQSMKTGFSYEDDTFFQMHYTLADAYVANGQIDEGKSVYAKLVNSCGDEMYPHFLTFLPSTGQNFSWLSDATAIHLHLTSKEDKGNTADNIIVLLELAKFYLKKEQSYTCKDLLENMIAKICAKCSVQDLTAIAKSASKQFSVPFCMEFAVALLKENSKIGALILLLEFRDNLSDDVQYLLARAHLENGSFAEGSKIAQSLGSSADNLSLACCAYILNSDYTQAIKDFNSVATMDFNSATNQFTQLDNMNKFTHELIEVLNVALPFTEELTALPDLPPLTCLALLDKLLPYLVFIPQNCLEAKAIICVMGIILFRINPALPPKTFFPPGQLDAKPSEIFNKALEHTAFVLFNEILFSPNDVSQLYNNFANACFPRESEYDSHRNYLFGVCNFLNGMYSEVSEPLGYVLEPDTRVGMGNHLTDRYQRRVAAAVLDLASFLQSEGAIDSTTFQKQMQVIVTLILDGLNLGPLERLLMLIAMDTLINVGGIEIDLNLWNEAKSTFIRYPDDENIKQLSNLLSRFLN